MDRSDILQFENQEEDDLTEVAQERRRVYTDKPDRSIFELYRQYQKGNLELQPEFQRRKYQTFRMTGERLATPVRSEPFNVCR